MSLLLSKRRAFGSQFFGEEDLRCECTVHGYLHPTEVKTEGKDAALKIGKPGKAMWFCLVNGDLYWFPARECDVHRSVCTDWCSIGADSNVSVYDDRSFLLRSEGKQMLYIVPDAKKLEKLEKKDKKKHPEGSGSLVDVKKWVAKIKIAVDDQREASERAGLSGVTLTHNGYLTYNKKKYYFVLNGKFLSWFKKDKDNKAVGKLALQGVDFERKSGLTTALTRGDMSMEITAANGTESDEWFRALFNAVKYMARFEQDSSTAIMDMLTTTGIALDVFHQGQIIPSVSTTLEKSDDIKLKILKKLMPGAPEQNYSTMADRYFLKLRDVDVYLVPEHLPLHKLPLLSICCRTLVVPQLELVEKSALRERGIDIRDLADTSKSNAMIEKGLKLEDERTALLGPEYSRMLASQTAQHQRAKLDMLEKKEVFNWAELPSAEFLDTRALMMAYVDGLMPDLIAHSKDTLLPQFVDNEKLPPNFDHSQVLRISCLIPGINCQKTLNFPTTAVPSEILAQFFEQYCSLTGNTVYKKDQFKLKVLGRLSYIIDDIPIVRFDYIVNCLNRHQPVQLCLFQPNLYKKEDEEMDIFLHNILRVHVSDPPVLPNATPSSSLTESFQFRIGDLIANNQDFLDQVIDFKSGSIDIMIYANINITQGGRPLTSQSCTTQVPFKYMLKGPQDIPEVCIYFNQDITINIRTCDIPQDAMLSVNVRFIPNVGVNAGKDMSLSWVNFPLVSRHGYFHQESVPVHMWPGEPPKNIGSPCENLLAKNAPVICFEFGSRDILCDHLAKCKLNIPGDITVSWRRLQVQISPQARQRQGSEPLTAEEIELMKFNKLRPVPEETKEKVWNIRWKLSAYPQYLPSFLLCVDWSQLPCAAEAIKLMYLWEFPAPEVGLELLDWRFSNQTVRQYAVQLLDGLSDGDLALYLVQLINAVKYEPRHDSPLCRLLVRRALQSKTIVGHRFFWLLRSELHTSRERLGVLLEAYLRGSGVGHIHVLYSEANLIQDLAGVAKDVKSADKDGRMKVLNTRLRKVNYPPRFLLPLFEDRECSAVDLQGCKYMKSKKLPLWLPFKNADDSGEKTLVMYKSGDDLRQDMLTLQLIRLMDNIWITQGGLDLCMLPYGVICTADEEGMVEVVTQSETFAGIARKAGGSSAVFKPEILASWLKEKNPEEDQYKAAVKNFALSAAGYCVATHVLGIGDRHNDNVMIRRDGRFFHIDFGHILGHFKKKFGIEREKAPFIFTPQMAYVLRGEAETSEMYQLFVDMCCRAYNIIRRNADVLESMLNLMLTANLPEVETVEDVSWVRQKLRLDLDDEAASKHFTNLIDESLHTVTTQIMDVIHIMAN